MRAMPTRLFWRFATTVLGLLLGSSPVAALAGKVGSTAPQYTYITASLVTPPPLSNPKPLVAEQSIMLMGGGYDVGEAFRWMIKRAGVNPTDGGDFLVIRASGTDAYNPYILSKAGTVDPTTPMGYEMVGGIDMGLRTASTLIIPNRTAANDPKVADIINKAHAIFIAGGNQADYYNYWKGTLVDAALRNALTRFIPIGGTSAGAEMLSQFAFLALNGAVTSTQALGDPFNKYMTIDPLTDTTGFIKPDVLVRTITDVHVNTRDRLGRSIAFMARLGKVCNGPINDTQTLAIALDEETALLYEGTKRLMAVNPKNPDNFTSGLYYGANSAYLVSSPTTAPSVCQSRTPLSYQSAGVQVVRLSDSGLVPAGVPAKTSYIATVNAATTLYGVNKGAISYSGTPAPY